MSKKLNRILSKIEDLSEELEIVLSNLEMLQKEYSECLEVETEKILDKIDLGEATLDDLYEFVEEYS